MRKFARHVIFIILALSLLLGSGTAAFAAPTEIPIPNLSQEELPPECYGILTDEYTIFYTQDETGAILMDQESLADLQTLLRDEQAMQKVIQDRAAARSEPVTSFEVAAQVKEIQTVLQPFASLKAMERIPTAKLAANAAVAAVGDLQNFTHQLNSERYSDATSNAPAYSQTHIKRQLVYMWAWEYEPFWTLTDTVAMAWSSGLHPLTGTDEVAFLYMAKGRESGKPVNTPSDDLWVLEGSEGDDAYSDDIDVDRGLQKDFDIKSVYNHGGKRYITTTHFGLFSVIVVASNPNRENKPITYRGKYYHQKVATLWSLNIGADLSIGLAAELRYDSSNSLIRTSYYFDA
ncbi:MAG: hypothetical protein ACLUVI_02285 [Acutalibacteraceae bacterium]